MPAPVTMPLSVDKLLLEYKLGNLDSIYLRKGGKKQHWSNFGRHRFSSGWYYVSCLEWKRLLETLRMLCPLEDISAIALFGEAVSMPWYWQAEITTGRKKRKQTVTLMYGRPQHVDVFIWTPGRLPRSRDNCLGYTQVDRPEQTKCWNTTWFEDGIRISGASCQEASHLHHSHDALLHQISLWGILLACTPTFLDKWKDKFQTPAIVKAERDYGKLTMTLEAPNDCPQALSHRQPFPSDLDQLRKDEYIMSV